MVLLLVSLIYCFLGDLGGKVKFEVRVSLWWLLICIISIRVFVYGSLKDFEVMDYLLLKVLLLWNEIDRIKQTLVGQDLESEGYVRVERT